MKKFDEINYTRPNYEETKIKLTSLINKLAQADQYDEYLAIFKNIIEIQNYIEEMHDYADIRNMRNSKDEFFTTEISYWNEYKPRFDILFNPFYELCINSKFKKQLKNIVPENFFNTIECQLKINSDAIVSLQKQENELKIEYRKILEEKIFFDGEERNLSYITGYFSNKDRSLRKIAHDTINDFYYKKQSVLDNIFLNLINTRNKIANKLGFDNYSVYSLYKLRRFGYNYSDISKFRNNIIKYIIPLCKKINEWKKQELAIDNIEYYDTIYFKEMPKLLYSGNELLTKIGESLKKINNDLYMFYKEMLENGYIDLETRDNKVSFAITNYLSKSAVPVITGNYKNSYLDIETTCHEFGHSYQKYNAGIKDKQYIVSSLLKYPTFDIAEMFSHAMELICMNCIDNLFNEQDYKKYCFMKIYNLISILPYICLVDEFQETVYSTKNITKEDIRKTWLKLAEKYGLQKNNQGHINLDSGGYFYRQTHIMLNPFYYIDYALSYFGAFAIAEACTNDLELFKEIGSVASYYPLDKLIKEYNMPNPFNTESVEKISKLLEDKLFKYKN